jgi:hypothetical protein
MLRLASRLGVRHAPREVPDGTKNVAETRDWPTAGRLVHLTGGLHALNRPQSRDVSIYALSPGAEEHALCNFNILEYHSLFMELNNIGLMPFGVAFYTYRQQFEAIDPPEIRHFSTSSKYGNWLVEKAVQTWSQIRNTAVDQLCDVQLMDLCQRITFELRAANLKWFEISSAYNQVLNKVVREAKFKDSLPFNDGNTFVVYVSIHSFLAEAASLRDYLAEYIANHILPEQPERSEKEYISKMASLRKQLTRSDIKHPLASYIVQSTDEDNAGWLAEMSAYRDLVLHHAPADRAHGMGFMRHHTVSLSSGAELPSVAFYLPADPFAAKRARARGGPFKAYSDFLEASARTEVVIEKEAMHYCHGLLGKLAALALDIAACSPVRPTTLRLGPGDIVK